jgi:hypothetical protein
VSGSPPVLFDPETGELMDPPPDLDYFSVFGLKKSFTLNNEELSMCKAAKINGIT